MHLQKLHISLNIIKSIFGKSNRDYSHNTKICSKPSKVRPGYEISYPVQTFEDPKDILYFIINI